MNLSSVLDYELVDIELPLTPSVVHEPDLTEHCSLRPSLNNKYLKQKNKNGITVKDKSVEGFGM